MLRALLMLVGAVFTIEVAPAQAQRPMSATELKALLANGLNVASADIEGGRNFTGRVSLQPGGRLTGTLNVTGHGAVALNGTWQLNGAQICRTLGPAQPELVCETWLRAGNAKEVTVVVKGKPVSVNRWQ